MKPQAVDEELRVVGQPVPPKGWEQRTDGTAKYTTDLELPGMLHAKIVHSPYPHARIRSIDVSGALDSGGVGAVATAADFAQDALYIHAGSKYSDRSPLARSVVRFIGEPIAVVAADTEEHAAVAAGRIKVKFRRLRAPLTVDEALSAGARALHARLSGEKNVAILDRGNWGDRDAAIADSAVSCSATYHYPRVNHACMEPNAVVTWWHGNEQVLEVWTSSQAPWFVQQELAYVLGLAPEQVICRDVAVGGGFGSKSKICEHEALAAILSMKASAPVRLVYTRAEEFSTAKPRHSFRTQLTTYARGDGRITAFDAKLLIDNGAYNHFGPSVLKVGLKTLGISYTPRAASWEARLVDTALTPGGQFRGYGHPQVGFAIESQVDELAERLGIDPIDLRLMNANKPFSTTLSGARIRSARLAECLETVRAEIGWDAYKREHVPYRGVGVACGMHGNGSYAHGPSNRSDAAIDLYTDGRARVRFGGADAGTGQRTILAQIAAEELGISADDVDVLMMDSERTPFDMGAWSSRGTHMGGHAVQQTARELAEHIKEVAQAKLGSEVLLRDGGAISDTGEISLGEIVDLSERSRDGVLTHESSYVDPLMELAGPDNLRPNGSASYTFAAHAALVEVDPATGRIKVLDYVAAHDVGRAINPPLARSQITGGTIQGLGAALGEELIYEGGRVVNDSYVDYALPRSADAPRVRTCLLEGPEDASPFDGKSVGEMPICLPAAVIANAVYDAIGVRFRKIPITPDAVVNALAARDGISIKPHLLLRPRTWWIEGMRRVYPLGLHKAMHTYGTRVFRKQNTNVVDRILMPSTREDLDNLLRPGTMIVAGGTDVMARKQQSLLPASILVSIQRVEDLRGIKLAHGGLSVGAAVTLSELADSVRGSLPELANAIETIASPQIRNVATVGGNLVQAKRCWFFRSGFDCYKRNGPTSPCYAVLGDHRFHHAAIGGHRCQAVTPSDLGTIFNAFDATVVISTAGSERHVPISEFYTGPGETILRDGDIVVRVDLPPRSLQRRFSFEKLMLWEGDFAVVSVAVSAEVGDDKKLAHARIIVGAIAPTPWRAVESEIALMRHGADTEGFRSAIFRELEKHGHPLPRNAWKLQAAANMIIRGTCHVARPAQPPE